MSPPNFLPAALNFPGTPIGDVSQPLTVTVDPENIGNFSARLADPHHFEVLSDTCTVDPVQTGQSCAITLVFQPDQFGHYSSSLVFLNSQGEILNFVPLEGLGIDGSFIPSPPDSPSLTEALFSGTQLDFPEMELFAPSELQTITVTNVGKAELKIKPITLGGDDPTSFSLLETCSLSPIPPAGICTIGAYFTPMAAGSLQGALAVSGNIEVPFILRLQGNGGPTPLPPSSGGCSLSGRNLASSLYWPPIFFFLAALAFLRLARSPK